MEWNSPERAHLIPVSLISLLRKPGHPQDLGGFQKATERALMDVHFTMVDKLHQGVQIAECHILQYYHRVLTRCALQIKLYTRQLTFLCNFSNRVRPIYENF